VTAALRKSVKGTASNPNCPPNVSFEKAIFSKAVGGGIIQKNPNPKHIKTHHHQNQQKHLK